MTDNQWGIYCPDCTVTSPCSLCSEQIAAEHAYATDEANLQWWARSGLPLDPASPAARLRQAEDDTWTETISRRAWYVTRDGRINDQVGIGPAIAEVRITQTENCTPSYYVSLDGHHQCGGFAHHLPANGHPASVVIWHNEIV